MKMTRETISVRHYKAGYEVRTEKVCYGEECFRMRSAYTENGDYIGTPKTAHHLYNIWGIVPELASPEDRVCSIGFCEKDQKWYGWSHRAMHGFSIGDVVKEGDCTASSGWTKEYLEKHPEKDRSLPVGFKAFTLNDAKIMAIAFAECVS